MVFTTVLLSLRFSQKVTWSRLMTIWSYGPCNSQPSFTRVKLLLAVLSVVDSDAELVLELR